ncbi:MAG: YcbK family protein [Phyllobacteriaceae bacterium]|nr:YcbK family protein [Phyllobacteriaceae bacterium]
MWRRQPPKRRAPRCLAACSGARKPLPRQPTPAPAPTPAASETETAQAASGGTRLALVAPAAAASVVPEAGPETAREENTQIAALDSLPGVDTKNIFALDPLSKEDEELYDDHPVEPVQLASASAAGLARLAPNGLLKQTDRVEVGCFKPELVRVLKQIERHYGKRLVVTSGYRSPKNNRRAGGSSRSLHMYCAAADVQIPGVGKWELAKFLRSMPGRGGVGTYCHTESVHIDIGSKRDWNWRCRRR